MAYATIIAMLALIEYQVFGFQVGVARGKGNVKAPAVTGDPTFERTFRAHQNTLEQLVIFIPALYGCAYYANEMLAVGAGVVFLVGRAMYFRAYSVDAEKRGTGMMVTMVGTTTLVLGALIGALLSVF